MFEFDINTNDLELLRDSVNDISINNLALKETFQDNFKTFKEEGLFEEGFKQVHEYFTRVEEYLNKVSTSIISYYDSLSHIEYDYMNKFEVVDVPSIGKVSNKALNDILGYTVLPEEEVPAEEEPIPEEEGPVPVPISEDPLPEESRIPEEEPGFVDEIPSDEPAMDDAIPMDEDGPIEETLTAEQAENALTDLLSKQTENTTENYSSVQEAVSDIASDAVSSSIGLDDAADVSMDISNDIEVGNDIVVDESTSDIPVDVSSNMETSVPISEPSLDIDVGGE